MKQLILCFIFLAVRFSASAQDTLSSAHSFSFSYNGVSAIGEFNSTEFKEDYPAFASDGKMYRVSYLRGLKNNLYAGASVALRNNSFNMDKFVRPDDELVLSKESKPWQSVFALADVQYRMYVRDGFLYLKGSVGAAFNRSAYLHIKTPYGPIIRTRDAATSFAYGISSGLQFDLDYVGISRLGIGVDGGILSTRPAFERQEVNGATIKYKQPMATLHGGVYISYTL